MFIDRESASPPLRRPRERQQKQPQRVRRPARRLAHEIAVLLAFWCERARTRRALARLDDRLLRDVGLDRATARKESRKPFWYD